MSKRKNDDPVKFDSVCKIRRTTKSTVYNHKVVIEDYKSVVEVFRVGENLRCDKFRVPVKLKQKNCLSCFVRLYPSGIKEDFKEYLSVYLLCEDPPSSRDVKMKVECSILGANCQKTKFVARTRSHDISTYKDGWGFATFIKHSELLKSQNLLIKGTLTLAIKIMVDEVDTAIKTLQHVDDEDVGFGILRKMWGTPEDYLSDFRIKCTDGEVACHSQIVGAASDYFKAFFTHDTKEKREGEVEIKGLDVETCNMIMQYIYTGELDQGRVTLGLYNEADGMGLVSLTKLCKEILIDNLNRDNCIATFLAADQRYDSNLKKAAAQVIVANRENLADDLKKEFKDKDMLVDMFITYGN